MTADNVVTWCMPTTKRRLRVINHGGHVSVTHVHSFSATHLIISGILKATFLPLSEKAENMKKLPFCVYHHFWLIACVLLNFMSCYINLNMCWHVKRVSQHVLACKACMYLSMCCLWNTFLCVMLPLPFKVPPSFCPCLFFSHAHACVHAWAIMSRHEPSWSWAIVRFMAALYAHVMLSL